VIKVYYHRSSSSTYKEKYMSLIPDALKYTKEHEWVQESSPTVIRMGITDYAQGALGDIVYVQLPKVGDVVVADKVCGEVESTKSVSEIFSPVSGTVVAINESLEANPEVLNSDPYGAGWLAEIEVSAPPVGLLSADGYRQITA
jgi:glycine cleavage system H protein